MYGRGHMRNGRSTEQSWTPPADYLAEQAARLAELELEQEEREHAEAVALAARLREAAAWWQHEPTTRGEEEMMAYVVIEDEVYPLETDEDFTEAKTALRDVGLPSTLVYVGEPDNPDSYANGQILFA